MRTVGICCRSFITTFAIWLLLLSPALATQRCKKAFVTNDAKSVDKELRYRRTSSRSCCLDCITSSTPRTAINTFAFLRGGSSRKGFRRRRDSTGDESMNHKSIGASYSSSTTTSSTRSHSLPQLLSSKHGRRTACSVYIWDAPSALLHRWCHHLQKDNIYEGLGGKKFVRIQPGSMLQLLYPCSRYSVDKCILCGGTFRDHLTLWWSKHLYTPYDRYLDQVYHDSVMKPSTTEKKLHDHLTQNRNKSGKSVNRDDSTSSAVEFGYHRQYVLDITTLFDHLQKPRDKAKELIRAIQHRYHQSTSPHMTIPTMEQRTWPRFSNQPKIKYIVPRSGAMVNDINSVKSQSGLPATQRPSKSFILWFARDVCLDAIDMLLDLEDMDRTKKVGTV